MRASRRLARAAWASCIGRGTPSWIAKWRSKFFLLPSRKIPSEAKVLASLNHPNIAQIYGIEDRALVMEMVPGETLKGPLSLETALNYAKQIAEALEAAHEKGITHRDLKPTNILVTASGVRLLDFGLAQVCPAPKSGDDSTQTIVLTPATE